MENNPAQKSSSLDKQGPFFGYFVKSESKGKDLAVPFHKDMAYVVTWVPTRKLLLLYGYDPRTPKPFTVPQAGTEGLQQKSYHEIRKEIFRGYSFDAMLYPLDLGVEIEDQDQSLQDFLLMQQLNPSFKPAGSPSYTVWRGIARIFATSTGDVILTTKPHDDLQVGSLGSLKLPEPGNY